MHLRSPATSSSRGLTSPQPRPPNHARGRALEMIRVREEAPAVRSGDQVVARPGVSEHMVIPIDRIPVHGREERMLAELSSLDLDRRPGAGRRWSRGTR